MSVLTTVSMGPLIFIACIIVAVVIIACFNAASKRKYKQKVDAVAAKTRQLSAALDELFKPVKRTTREDVDHFLADNHDAINAAKEITETRSRFRDLLKPSGIHEFLAKVQPDALQSSIAEKCDGEDKEGLICARNVLKER